MRSTKVDWQLLIFANAVHGFTNPDNGSDPSKGAAYNKQADMPILARYERFLQRNFLIFHGFGNPQLSYGQTYVSALVGH